MKVHVCVPVGACICLCVHLCLCVCLCVCVVCLCVCLCVPFPSRCLNRTPGSVGGVTPAVRCVQPQFAPPVYSFLVLPTPFREQQDVLVSSQGRETYSASGEELTFSFTAHCRWLIFCSDKSLLSNKRKILFIFNRDSGLFLWWV